MPDAVWKVDDLIFPEASGNFSHTLSSLKRHRLSIKNRIASILSDAEYVESVAETYALPLVANERCGSWYIPPEKKAGSVYFKSTDGHQSQWKFSTRRLNLQVLEVIGRHDGCIIADSTRRGKLMPDALSKTVPIWCTVLNRLLFPEKPASHTLIVSEQVVAASEASQISRLLDGFVADLESLNLDKTALRQKLGKPLRPYFLAPELGLRDELKANFCAILCCSASRREHGDNDEYIQGAGDDNEHWSLGLTADMFWEHRGSFASKRSDEEFACIIDGLVKSVPAKSARVMMHKVYGHGSLERSIDLCTVDNLQLLVSNAASSGSYHRPYDLLIKCDIEPNTTASTKIAAKTVHLKCSAGKTGGRMLRNELPKIDLDLRAVAQGSSLKVLVSCFDGRDLSIGLALAVACRLDQEADPGKRIDKSFIRQRLAAITADYPSANPSRATLQSVNAYLMQERSLA